MDGDGTYPAEYIPRLLRKMKDGGCCTMDSITNIATPHDSTCLED
ncbi:MAG: hypothetical protein QW348_04555 [Ignisphaera sp.]